MEPKRVRPTRPPEPDHCVSAPYRAPKSVTSISHSHSDGLVGQPVRPMADIGESAGMIRMHRLNRWRMNIAA